MMLRPPDTRDLETSTSLPASGPEMTTSFALRSRRTVARSPSKIVVSPEWTSAAPPGPIPSTSPDMLKRSLSRVAGGQRDAADADRPSRFDDRDHRGVRDLAVDLD